MYINTYSQLFCYKFLLGILRLSGQMSRSRTVCNSSKQLIIPFLEIPDKITDFSVCGKNILLLTYQSPDIMLLSSYEQFK